MKSQPLIGFVAIVAAFNWQAIAQTYDTNNVVVQTFAGSGFSGYADGTGQQTMFKNPLAIVADTSSNLFVLDSGNSRIRKITPDGTVSTFAGGGTQYEGYGTSVSLVSGSYSSMTIDHSNTLWFGINIQTLVRIRSDGYVSKTTLTNLNYNSGLCVDSGNSVYFSDPQGNKIYRYRTNGVVEVFAGSGNLGSVDGNGIFTSFNIPTALACDAADNIYVWDSGNGNHLIRRINQNRDVVTIAGKNSSDLDGAGTNASFSSITAMCVDGSGNVILASWYSIRKMTAATNVVTLAGSFTYSDYTNGVGNLARFKQVEDVCVSQGMIFVSDLGSQRIRQISFEPQIQVVSGANLGISTFAGVTITGTVGRTYQVQSSPDMTNWTTQSTLLLTSTPYLWIDRVPVSGSKFYRALLLP